MLKRLTAFALCLLMLLSGCAAQPKDDGITVIASIFPEYDWARQIIGEADGIKLQLLMGNGVDPHSYQPTVRDMTAVASSDLLIYGGGESDEWLDDVLEADGPEALALLPLLGDHAHAAQYTEGMQARVYEDETDEHVWLSLRNAAFFCTAIADSLCRLDPENAAIYQANLSAYLTQLDDLDAQYCEVLQDTPKNTILVCDRFPYRYLVADYGLDYYAAFPGCSAESGASFQTIVFLAEKLREQDLNAVLITEGSDDRIAHTVIQSSGRDNVPVLVLHSMQSVSLKEAAARTYLATMADNLQVLKAALH